MRSAEEECGVRNSRRCAVRKRSAGCGTRPDARCGRGVRGAELAPMRGAEEECGVRNSPRCAVRKRSAGCGTRPDARCGRGVRSAELAPMRIAEKECGSRVHVPEFLLRTAHRVEFRNPDSFSALRTGSSSGIRIPSSHCASGRVPESALLLRTPHWAEPLRD